MLAALYQRSVMRGLETELSSVIDGLLVGVQARDGAVMLLDPPNEARFSRVYSGRYFEVAVLREGGRLEPAARSRSLYDAELSVRPELASQMHESRGRTEFFDAPGPDGQPLRAAVQIVALEGVHAPVVLIAAADSLPAMRDAQRFATTLWIALVAMGLGLLGAVYLQVRVGLAPLQRVREDLGAVRRNRATRLSGAYPLEIEPLTNELNALLDHNRAVVERARTHVGNLAHALKTPLSVLRNEAARDEGALAALIARQTEAMARNVDHYLQRAQAAARAEAIGARSDVAPVLEDLARTLERLYGRQKDLDLTLEIEPGLVFRGERQDLEEIAGNLMENACKYGKSRVLVRAAAERREAIVLAVEDDGAGMEPAAAAEAVKRGKRLDETAPGQGLGLSIVADLAQLYGGELALERSGLGGLRATLRLPMAD